MIRAIATKEATAMIRDGRFRFASMGLAVLLCLAWAASYHEFVRRFAAQQAFAQRERERWLGQGVTSPHSAAHHGVYAFKPQSPLAVIDPGIDRWAGTVVFLEAHSQNFLRFRPAADGPALRRFGELSAAAILEIVVPLILALLAYDCFAAERENGTLRLLLSLGVRRRDLIVGKAAGVALPLIAVLIPAAALGAVVLSRWQPIGGTRPEFLRLGFMVTGYTLYFCVFLGVILAISLAARSARLALLAGLSFWFWNSVAAPQIATDIARWIAPTPQPLDVVASITEHIASRPTLWDRRREINERLKKQYNVSSILELPVNPGGIMLLEQEEDDTRATSGNVGRVYTAQARQEYLYKWGGLAVPLLALQPLTMGLAGTDLYHHQHFASLAEQYRREFVLLLNEASAYDESIRRRELHPRVEATVSMAGPGMWAKVRPFHYVPPAIGAVLKSNQLTLALSTFWIAAVPLILAMASRRWRPD